MIDRRTIISAALAAIAGPVSARSAMAQVSRITAYAFSFPALAGGDIRLGEYAGRPLMVVNTASLCGYTPQYAGLQELWVETPANIIVPYSKSLYTFSSEFRKK